MLLSLVALAANLYWARGVLTAWINLATDDYSATSPASSLPVVDLNYTLQRANIYNVRPRHHALLAQRG